MSLFDWGWNGFFEAIWHDREREPGVPARVIAQSRGMWRVAGDFGERPAEAAGRLRMAAEEGADWPAVGDWVVADVPEPRGAASIREVLPRRSQFVRKVPGKKMAGQVIAANADTALLVSALDYEFNPRRVERYLAQCWDSGARPVIVLNKADAGREVPEKLQQTESIAMGVPVCVVSARTGQGFDGLAKHLARGETVVLLGSSGVGKSTMVNRLMARTVQQVREVRESDSRGRHRTTVRQIFPLPGGALLMDTPGLRELQLWDAEEGIGQAFADLDALAAQCRFTNCRHDREPGCAVLAAVRTGAVGPERLENWRKLRREMEFLRRKIDPQAMHEEKQRIKQLMRGMRKTYRGREKR